MKAPDWVNLGAMHHWAFVVLVVAITLAFGGPGQFGEQSGRVIDRMRAHVESVGCLAPGDFTLLADGFESGDTAAWSWQVP